MKSRVVGIIILAAVVLIASGIYLYKEKMNSAVVVKGLVGGEKTGFLDDDAVKKILKNKYGLVLDYSKAGSIEMVQDDKNSDFIFPSSQVALDLYKETKGKNIVKSESVLNSPLVIYSWDIVTDALIKQQIVQKTQESYYIVDFPKLVELILQNKKWSDIGLNELYGNITVSTTDPTKSNSGNMFSGLLSIVLNGGMVDETTVSAVLPKVKSIFQKSGYMESSSGDLFEQYLKTGPGAKPMMVGYENQIIEFASQNPEVWKTLKDKVRILYPVPTVWSAHPVIALNQKSVGLIDALKDEDVQNIAWEKHGFRTGVAGVFNDTKIYGIVGIPESITQVTSMPTPKVMEMIIQALQ